MESGSIDVDFLEKLLRDIDEAIGIILNDVSKPYTSLSRPEKSEIKYYVIVLAEALMSLALHLARRMFHAKPETPISALRILVDEGLMKESEFDDAASLVRLRNLLVHRYWLVDDRRIYNNARQDFKNIRSFISRVGDKLGIEI